MSILWETLQFFAGNYGFIGAATLEHISLMVVAVGLAVLTGVPIGIAIKQNKTAADVVFYVASIIIIIPSIALFGLMIPILSKTGQGIGYLPAVIAILLYAPLPIICNTCTTINNVAPALRLLVKRPIA